MSFTTPVLFCVFNRPAQTGKVFEVLRKVKPTYLYIAADGPRIDRPDEERLCAEVKDIVINGIDWDCEVKTLLRNQNLGCKMAISGAINWFFEDVEDGIILEDDCLPDESFFPFCSELLDRYRNDETVMSISGTNLLGNKLQDIGSSYFFGHGGIWGWATWKRAWAHYDIEMTGWGNTKNKEAVLDRLLTDEWRAFYTNMFDAAYRGDLDTWDAQWLYSMLVNNGLGVHPIINLVKNIGFGADATHTHNEKDYVSRLESHKMLFPLRHPTEHKPDMTYLRMSYLALVPSQSLFRRIYSRLKKSVTG